MPTTTVTLTGSWLVVVGLVVAGLSQCGVNVTNEQVETIIGGAIAVYGVIHQIVIHFKATGKLI